MHIPHETSLPSDWDARTTTSDDGDATIAYYVCGKGPAVLMIQGMGLSADGWLDAAARVARAGFTAIVPDNRGTGRSRGDTTLQFSTLASDTLAVLDAQSCEEALIVGVSLGGMIAQHLTIHHTARVRGLLLASTTPGIFTGEWPRLRDLWEFVQLGMLEEDALPEALSGSLGRHTSEKKLEQLADIWNEETEREGMLKHLLAQGIGALFHEAGDALSRYDGPVTILAGDEDKVLPAANARRIADLFENARCRIVSDHGHLLVVERPELLVEEIERLHIRAMPDDPNA